MIITVLGDSHKDFSSIDKIGDILKKSSLIIHTGDNYGDLIYIQNKYNSNAIGVKGNCDWEKEAVEERLEIIGDKKVFITHGHRYGVKYNLNNIFYKGKELEADIVVFGHSHIPLDTKEENIILLNPGSISLPRGNFNRSFATLEIKEDTITTKIIQL